MGKQSHNYVSLSLDNKKKGKQSLVNKSLEMKARLKKTKMVTQRPNKSIDPIHDSHMSQKQSHIVIVDALRETLQKRLGT